MSEAPAVLRERQCGDDPGVAAEHRLVLPARRAPEPDSAVAADRGDPLSIRAVDRREDVGRG